MIMSKEVFHLKVEGGFILPEGIDPTYLMNQFRGVILGVLPEGAQFEIFFTKEVTSEPPPPEKQGFMKRVK
jgi:hypothetical protein